MKNQTAFLILSCDAYSGLWETHFSCLDTHWADCPFPKYLLSNFKDSGRDEIKTIKVGEDVSWSANLKKTLQILKKEYSHVLLSFDDLFLTQKVDNKQLENVIEAFKKEKGAFLQLIKWHNKPKKVDQYIGILEIGSLYRPNCVYALWDIEVLDKLLDPNENAWEFERKGAKRSDKFEGFYAVQQSIFQYRNVVIRGKIVRKDANNFNMKDIKGLKVMSIWDNLKFYLRYLGFKIFLFLVPRKYQAPIARIKSVLIPRP